MDGIMVMVVTIINHRTKPANLVQHEKNKLLNRLFLALLLINFRMPNDDNEFISLLRN